MPVIAGRRVFILKTPLPATNRFAACGGERRLVYSFTPKPFYSAVPVNLLKIFQTNVSVTTFL
jgi:hypothetical protein